METFQNESVITEKGWKHCCKRKGLFCHNVYNSNLHVKNNVYMWKRFKRQLFEKRRYLLGVPPHTVYNDIYDILDGPPNYVCNTFKSNDPA